MPGMWEWLIILVIVLLVFGAGKLPGIGDALGKSIRNFKRSSAGSDEIEVSKKADIDSRRSRELDEADEDAEVGAGKRRAAKEKA